MEQTEDFTWVIPSNASFDIHPNNTTSDFTVSLQTPLHLTGDWEVAVVSIYFPGVVSLINNSNSQIGYQTTSDDYWIPLRVAPMHEVSMRTTNRESWVDPRDFDAFDVSFKMQEYENGIQNFRLTNNRRKKLMISGKLADYFGLNGSYVFEGRGEKLGSYTEVFLSHIFVKTNLVQDVRFDDNYAPILLHASVTNNGTVKYRPKLVNYFPIKNNYISEARFEIVTNKGYIAEFQQGATVVELHFRKRY